MRLTISAEHRLVSEGRFQSLTYDFWTPRPRASFSRPSAGKASTSAGCATAFSSSPAPAEAALVLTAFSSAPAPADAALALLGLHLLAPMTPDSDDNHDYDSEESVAEIEPARRSVPARSSSNNRKPAHVSRARPLPAALARRPTAPVVSRARPLPAALARRPMATVVLASPIRVSPAPAAASPRKRSFARLAAGGSAAAEAPRKRVLAAAVVVEPGRQEFSPSRKENDSHGEFKAGMRVLARNMASTMGITFVERGEHFTTLWYPGVVGAVHADGTVSVEYDDGEHENVKPCFVKPEPAPRKEPEPVEPVPKGQCATPGCSLPKFHDGVCSSQRVAGPRERRPSARKIDSVSQKRVPLTSIGAC